MQPSGKYAGELASLGNVNTRPLTLDVRLFKVKLAARTID
jgi:hypothetical protein